MQLNPASNELIFKVVYYGPGMSGKTTNLTFLHDRAPAGTASDLVTVDTHSERTLHFDLLAVDLGQIQGHTVRVEFRTVPGQNYYAATRRQVLTGADAVVFVADARREALDENIESMNELLDNLRQLGLPTNLPLVLQYNKQDLATALKPEQLDPLMNVRGWRSLGASAIQGQGVAECARLALDMLAEAAANVSVPQVATAPTVQSWLISCYRCQTMLEVPNATPGAVFACGACNTALEIVDPERGITRQPVAAAAPAKASASGSRPVAPQEPSEYSMRSLPSEAEAEVDARASALQPVAGGLTPNQNAASVGALDTGFDLPGWEAVALLDESPQGRRLRVRETATGRFRRALVLSPSLLQQPGYREELEPYVRMAGPLKHPNVLPLLELRTLGHAIVLFSADTPEYEPLIQTLGRRRALAPPHAMGILRQVVLALEDAARQGVVHGWLRPECILVNAAGAVYVDEFAVPKNPRYLTKELAGASAATEYYLAPEYLNEGALIDSRSDMFLCGALLYRMITGEGLVTGYNAHEGIHKLLAAGGRPLRAVGNTVSRDLDLFFRRLTAVDRGERFENYRELVEIMDRFGGGAKRQTLRLTQNITGHGQPPAHGSATRPHANRTTTSLVGPGHGTPVGARSVSASGMRPIPQFSQPVHHPVKSPPRGSGRAAMILIVIVVLALVAGVAVWVWSQTNKPGSAPKRVTPPSSAPVAHPETAPPTAVKPANAEPTPSEPTVPVPPPVVELSPMERRDLLARVADLALAEKYQQALTEVERLPNRDDRKAQSDLVVQRRDERRAELERRAKHVASAAEVQALVRPALDGTWGMPGDSDWAKALIEATTARLAGGTPPPSERTPAPEPAPAEPPATPPATTPPATLITPAPAPAVAPPAVADPVLVALTSLAQGQFTAAQSQIQSIPDTQVNGSGLRLIAKMYGLRAGLLDRVAKGKVVHLQLNHPVTREAVDVASADAKGITVSLLSGGTTGLTWNQLSAVEIARLLAEATAAPGVTSEDLACAVAGLVIAGDLPMAVLQSRRAKSQVTAEQSATLENMVDVGRHIEAIGLLARANEANAARSTKALTECLGELRRPDRARLAVVSAALPELEAALKELLKSGTP
ncbi:MAG: protein kinase [Planctomycetota bacterium]